MTEARGSTDPLIGKSFGPYTVTRKLGEGGMAIVYKGFQESLNRNVAIKVLRAELAQDPEFITRFQREAQAVAKLNHPNILHVYDAGVAYGVYYIVMDYVDGGSLRDLIARGPLSVERAVSIAAQLADALDYAHRQNVVHRDVKPANVLLAHDGRPLLTDFGIARLLDEKGLTRTGTSMGTPEYMAPEQVQGQPTDPRTDIYSLGLVLYEMLAGWVPFSTPTPVATLFKQVNEPPPPLHQMNISIPAWLEDIVNLALAKRPAERFQTAGEFAAALREEAAAAALARPVTPHPRRVEPVAAAAQPAAKPAGRHRNLAIPILLGAIAVVVVGLAVLWYSGALNGSPAEIVPPATDTETPIVIVVTSPPNSNTATPVASVATPSPIASTDAPVVVVPTRQGPAQIAFTSRRDGNAEIYVMDAEGTAQTNLTHDAAEEYWPQWSPDASKIAFHSYAPGDTSGHSQIYVMDAAGGNWKQLTDVPAQNKFPGWSPNGRQIVFASEREGNFRIYVMNSDGSDVRSLTNDTFKNYYPSWCSDGWILFDSDRTGNGEIFAMQDDGSHVVNLTMSPAQESQAACSPDASLIAFGSDRSGRTEVWVMRRDGSNPVQLTFDGGSEPRWSSDGTKIVFTSSRTGNSDIFVMNSDGSQERQLTNSPQADLDSAWEP